MKKQNYQDGFSVLHLLVAFIPIGIIGFTGWYVYSSQNSTDKTLSDTSKSTYATQSKKTETKPEVKPEAYKVPDGYIKYENKDLGFSFAYPKEYGEVASLATNSIDSPDKHLSGRFTVQTFAKDESITARKYGPTVHISKGRLITDQLNPADVLNTTTGNEYRDLDGHTVAPQSNDGLQIFTLKGADEGSLHTQVIFETKTNLIVLGLPTFGETSVYEVNPIYDQNSSLLKPEYNTLIKNVADSVHQL